MVFFPFFIYLFIFFCSYLLKHSAGEGWALSPIVFVRFCSIPKVPLRLFCSVTALPSWMLLFFAVSCLQFTGAVVLIHRPFPTPISQTYGIWSNKWQSSPASFIPSLAFVSCRREFPPAGFIMAEWSSVLDAGQKWKIMTPESSARNITNDLPTNGTKCQEMISNKWRYHHNYSCGA